MYKNRELFREQQDTVLEHLVKSSAKSPALKNITQKTIFPSVSIALEKLNDYIKKTKALKRSKDNTPELTLTRWY